MTAITTPAEYEAWYHSPRGRWIGASEYKLLHQLLQPKEGSSLLDVGCGTGYFSRRFQQAGLKVSGIDPDAKAIKFARLQDAGINYQKVYAESLPFDDLSFDYSSAITSFCFIDNPHKALAEMWRVTRKTVVIGLLNRQSLLYHSKHDRGNYRGAHWYAPQDILTEWIPELDPAPEGIHMGSAVCFHQGNHLARLIEKVISNRFLRCGFLAVVLNK